MLLRPPIKYQQFLSNYFTKDQNQAQQGYTFVQFSIFKDLNKDQNKYLHVLPRDKISNFVMDINEITQDLISIGIDSSGGTATKVTNN